MVNIIYFFTFLWLLVLFLDLYTGKASFFRLGLYAERKKDPVEFYGIIGLQMILFFIVFLLLYQYI